MKKMVLFAALLSLSCSGYAYAADSTAFDPTKVRIQAQNSIPVGTVIAWHSTGNPADMRNPDGTYNWLECNGQSISQTVYPELFAVVGARTPDFRGQFLRGLDVGHSVGERVQDTVKSHAHGQPAHTHSWNGQLASTALTGTAAGQQFNDTKAGISSSPVQQDTHQIVTAVTSTTTNEGHSHTVNFYKGYLYADTIQNQSKSSSVSGRLNSGTVNGTVSSSGGDDTYATGDAETAPKHVYVRYFIRARP